MKKLLIAIAAAATAIGTYAATAIGGAQFEKGDTTPYTWTQSGQDEGVFTSGYWTIPADATTTWVADDCGIKDAEKRPAGYDELGRKGAMAIKTTFGHPIYQNTKESGTSMIDAGFYYDGLVKFTACDETPDLNAAAYENAKIGFFPLLESEDATEADLYIWADGGTNLWKTTTKIDDQWHRVTIKMIENVNRPGATAQVGFVVFIDGDAVECFDAQSAFTSANLDPAVREKWYNNGQLFASLTDDTTVTGVLYDGQGSIDEVGFVDATDAPGFAADDKWGTLTWKSQYITKVYVIDADGNEVVSGAASPIDFQMEGETSYKYYYDAAPGYVSLSKENAIDFDDTEKVNEIEGDPDTCAASVTINDVTTQYGEMEEAIGAVCAAEEATLTLEGDHVGELYFIPDEGTLTLTLDLNGYNITADVGDSDAICFDAGVTATIVNSKETRGVVDGESVGYAVAATSADFLTIEAGTYIGAVDATDAEYAAITGGKFSIEGNNVGGECTLVAPEGYKFVEGEDDDEGFWVLTPDLSVAVTFVDGTNCAVTKVDGEDYEAGTELKFEKGATAKVTYEAAEGFTFQDGTEVTVDVEITEAGAIPAKVDAFAAKATIGDKFYPSVEAAYEAAADAGDTLYLVADSQLEGMLKIEKNLTIDATGDYTLTGPSGAYGLVIAANVTLKGGTIKELATESRSIVNVGNPAGGDFGDEAFVGNLVLDGATIKGAGADTKAGNAIAAANGTVTITSGTITDIGARGVKAEGTAVITINGGTITSNGTKPALYVKEHGSIIVNGGTIDGVIENAATSTATITIPGTSTATFDRDQSTFCAPGYKTFENGDGRWEVKEAKAVTITAGEGIASVMAGTTNLVGAVKIQPADLETEVTLTAVETIKTPVFKIAVNGAAAIEVTSPFKLSSYITYATIVEDAKVVFTAEEGAAPIDPVDPEEPKSYDTPEKAADAAKAINENKEAYIKSPKDATEDFNKADYVKNFEAVVGKNNTVMVQLTETAQAELQEQVNSDVVTKIKPAELAAAAGEAQLATTPGFYYTVVAGNGIGTMAPKSCTFAVGTETKVDLPSFSGAGFYTIKVTVKPVEIPNGK